MKARSLVFLSTLLLILVLLPNPKVTATTYYSPPPCVAFNEAKAVFIGKVINATQKREFVYGNEPTVSCSSELAFEVIEPFSGTPERLMNVWYRGGATCEGMGPKLGEIYLVYAHEDEDKKLWVGVRTRPLKPALIHEAVYQWSGKSPLRWTSANSEADTLWSLAM